MRRERKFAEKSFERNPVVREMRRLNKASRPMVSQHREKKLTIRNWDTEGDYDELD